MVSEIVVLLLCTPESSFYKPYPNRHPEILETSFWLLLLHFAESRVHQRVLLCARPDRHLHFKLAEGELVVVSEIQSYACQFTLNPKP